MRELRDTVDYVTHVSPLSATWPCGSGGGAERRQINTAVTVPPVPEVIKFPKASALRTGNGSKQTRIIHSQLKRHTTPRSCITGPYASDTCSTRLD